MEPLWIRCEPMHDQEKFHCQSQANQGSHTWKTRLPAARCGSSSKRCFQTGVSSDGVVQGRFEATGIRPRFLDHLMTHGITLSTDLFRPDARLQS